ncbi:SLIT and NTRK-like protein 6 [Schistocerca cancellata]|uniref:SLIT and NTRK-like protein 6 n=1 Tax=Schistocerca cancellata TaxID=274614 RepID=UPI002118A672|nr:SLIT and NTRK-like protein 6 [Schistocerca cancellata]
MRALAAALAVAAALAGAEALSYWRPTTPSTTTVRPEEACHLPCRCLRLSRWTPRMRAHCLVVWDSDRRPHPPFQLDSSVDEVDFARSRIHKLYAVHLEGLERVKVMHMNGVGLASITTNAFDQLPDLWSVSLERNHLSSVPPFVFVRNRRLHYLSLRRNMLTVHPGMPLVGASSLEVLDVSECGIDAVYEATFRPLRKLRQLHLEGNLLRVLPAGTTAQVPQLVRLFLQRNNLIFFPGDAIKNLPQLLELRLDGNRLMQGPLGPLQAPKLQRLSAADCALQSVQPDLLAAAPELRYLDLQANRLRTLWLANESAEAHLVLLDVERNPLECDCALRDTWNWAEEHVDEAIVYCGEPPRPWQDVQLHKLDCDKTAGQTASTVSSVTGATTIGTGSGVTAGASDGATTGASTGGSEAGAAALWASLSLLAVLAAVGGALLFVYRHEVLARYFSPEARAAASGGNDVLPLERNHTNATDDVPIGLPDIGQPHEGGVAPWLRQ